MLHLPLVVVKVRVDAQDLLEVRHVELAFGLTFHHLLDVGEGRGILADLEHVQGLINLVHKLLEDIVLFWEFNVLASRFLENWNLLDIFRFHFLILLNWLLSLKSFFCLLGFSGSFGLCLSFCLSFVSLLLLLLDFDLSLDLFNLAVKLLLS